MLAFAKIELLLQAFVWYPHGTADSGRNDPTAWFKGGPTPVNTQATNPNQDAVVYIRQPMG